VFVWDMCGYVMDEKLKLLKHLNLKHRGMGFR